MHCVSYALAPELWRLIIASLSSSDLTRLSITSSRLLHIVRPVLYRVVSLTVGIHDTDPSYALTLLARDKELAKCVVELRLDRKPPSDLTPNTTHSLISPDALANLLSLNRILIRGCVFLTAFEQHEFGRVLAGVPLKELTYSGYHSAEKWPGDEVGGICDLKKIVWETRNGIFLDPMWDILSRSRTTINTLSLPFASTLESPCLRLWNTHFPHLRSLTLGFWDIEAEVESLDAPDFTDFILAHNDTIEELDIEYGEYDEYALQFNESSLTRLRPDSLPHLRSFRGNATSFMIMAQARMKCLTTTLRRLVVGPGGIAEPTYHVRWMFNAILSLAVDSIGSGPVLHGLSALTELNLDLSEWEDRERTAIVESIRRCAECCGPSLEVWRGSLPSVVEMDAEELGELFGLFERLRIIYLDADIIPKGKYEDDEGEGAAYVRILASKCGALEEVSLNYDSPPHLIVVWEVSRGRISESGEGWFCSVRRVVQ